VLYGPESDQVFETHHQLRCIARAQGNLRKAAHHKTKILQIQTIKNRQKYQRMAAERIDWSILARED
jgi:hypothetical protein